MQTFTIKFLNDKVRDIAHVEAKDANEAVNLLRKRFRYSMVIILTINVAKHNTHQYKEMV